MAAWGYGLRAKSMLALVIACLLALLPLGLVGWQVMDGIRGHFGESYARNVTELSARNVLAPVTRDLALSRRLADSTLAEAMLRHEEDPVHRARFFREAERYRDDFRDANYFLISAATRHYYTNDAESEYSEAPRYTLDPENPDDAWFFNIMAGDEVLNINVNPDAELAVTRVWLNVVVRDEAGERLGMAGTGLELDEFLARFVDNREAGVTPMILDNDGAIQAHPDPERIAYGTAAGEVDPAQVLPRQLAADDRDALREAMRRAEAAPGEVELVRAGLGGREQLLALTFVEELDWHVVNAVDLQVANVVEGPWMRTAVAALLVTLLVLMAAFAYGVDRVVLRPLRRLNDSAKALAEGRYDVDLPAQSRDELGDLGRAFGTMAEQVRDHTEALEQRVEERTRALEQANREMAASQKTISDSIDYASVIQRALLPDAQMAESLGEHFVLWHPRDGVGGDFYLFRRDETGYLVGVVDCAGHGVPGALMTMLARAAFTEAMNRIGITSPAALLTQADASLREMVLQSEMPSSVATNLDAGLVYLDTRHGHLRFAGARIGLHWSDGTNVEEIRGGRRALCDRRQGSYRDYTMEADPRVTYYMVTDGYLDQAGGEHGFGFGNTRFAELLRAHARQPLEEQAVALERELADYRGEHDQRDDITVLSFRFDPMEIPA